MWLKKEEKQNTFKFHNVKEIKTETGYEPLSKSNFQDYEEPWKKKPWKYLCGDSSRPYCCGILQSDGNLQIPSYREIASFKSAEYLHLLNLLYVNITQQINLHNLDWKLGNFNMFACNYILWFQLFYNILYFIIFTLRVGAISWFWFALYNNRVRLFRCYILISWSAIWKRSEFHSSCQTNVDFYFSYTFREHFLWAFEWKAIGK